MDICIGGPWHGSIVLKCKTRKEQFRVKNSLGQSILYERRPMMIGSRNLNFWLDSSLSNDQINKLLVIVIQKYGNST